MDNSTDTTGRSVRPEPPVGTAAAPAPASAADGTGPASGGPGRKGPGRGEPRRRRARRPLWPPFAIFGWFAQFLASALTLPLNVAVAGAFAAAVLLQISAEDLPDVNALVEVKFEEPLRVYTANGALMAEFGVQRRRAVAFAAIPPLLIDAFVATEDSRFFDHAGIDIIGLGRALTSVVKTGAPTQGGSTITMQVARNFFLTRDKTIKRKIAEILLAFEIERSFTKEQIMELYLNKIFFGQRAYGISAAAELYYNKTLDQLTLDEMAVLAGLPKAPSANNPLINPERALERRNYILDRMLELGFIDGPAHAEARARPLTTTGYVAPIEFPAGYVAEMARQEMVERYGEENVYSMGLKVYTTIEEPLQKAADSALREGLWAYTLRHGYTGPEDRLTDVRRMSEAQLDEYLAERPVIEGLPVGVVTASGNKGLTVYLGGGKTRTLAPAQYAWARANRGGGVKVGDVIRLRVGSKGDWVVSQVPKVGGALAAISPWDGAIKAMAGGYSFEWSKFNRVVDAKRQPGSTFKAFVYAAALAKGYTPASIVRDQPFSQGRGRGAWSPKNSDGKYMGAMPMRKALAISRNLAVIHLANRMGVEYTRNFMPNFGFALESIPADLPMVIGSGSLTPMEVLRGFATFANGGYLVKPYLVARVEDVQGNQLYQAEPARACRECWLEPAKDAAKTSPPGAAEAPRPPVALDPRVAYQMDSMLRDVITKGTAKRALALKRKDLAGKTGTTNDARDAWFVGYAPDLAAVAWLGHDDNRPLGHGEWGGTAALGMWVDFMKPALADVPVATLRRPESMTAVRVDPASGRTIKGKSGGVVEYIPTELELMTLGPDPETLPAEDTKPKAKAAKPKPKRTAPRVLDELF